MDTGLKIKSIRATQAGSARPESSLRTPVATELDPSQTVTAALDNAAPTGNDTPRNAPPPQPMSHDVLIDPQAREVMFRAMTQRGGQADDETPEEALLKLKAYTRAERRKRQADGETLETTV